MNTNQAIKHSYLREQKRVKTFTSGELRQGQDTINEKPDGLEP